MRLKVLDRLFFKEFIGPCLLAFFIVEFVLIMQNLWKQIDNILGKGYGILDFIELLSYFALAIIPMALPLTILLSSVMVYGDMTEKHELSSAKTSGISFFRLLRPGLMISLVVFSFSIFSANFLKPEANEGFYKKLRDMRTNKLTYAFDENVFNREFKDFSIWIGKKYKDGRTIDDVLIYNHSDADNSVVHMIRAKSGEMYTSPDQKYLVMDLKNGYQIRELRKETAGRVRKGHNAFARPVARFTFSSLRKVFNLSEMLDLNVVNVSYKQYEMMNTSELFSVIDSLKKSKIKTIADNLHEFVLFEEPKEMIKDSKTILSPSLKENILKSTNKKASKKSQEVRKKILQNRRKKNEKERLEREKRDKALTHIFPKRIDKNTRSIINIVEFPENSHVLDKMKKNTQSLRTSNSNHRQEVRVIQRNNDRYVFSLHQIYSWAFVCIIFLFIGAPAGAIIGKGGFGYPLLIAIGFYLTFVMSSIIGKKLTFSGAVSAPLGAWLPCLLLIPFAVYLSWRALNDNRPFVKLLLSKWRMRWGR